MKRLYLVIFLVTLCIGIGIGEKMLIEHTADKTIKSLEKIDAEIATENFEKAEKLLDTTVNDYENFSENFMFCCYHHNNLESISQNMNIISEALKGKNFDWYRIYSSQTKKQLQALKDSELFNLQNII